MRDIIDMETARCDIGGDQETEATLLEVVEDAQPFLLRDISGKHCRLVIVVLQAAGQVLRLPLGIDEDHDPLGRLFLFQQAEQQRKLFAARDMIEYLVDPFGGDLLRLDPYLLGQIHELVGQLHHPLRQGRRIEHGLSLLERRQLAQDEAEVLDEAHVEHPVGLIDDQRLDAVQREDPLLEVVDQPARGGDDNIDTVPERLALLLVIDAAENRLHLEGAGRAEPLGILADLHHQLAGRSDDQGAGIVRGLLAALQQFGKKGNQEGGSLAGAGLRLSGDVASLQGQRNRFLLHRGEFGKSNRFDALHHLGRKVQFGKFHISLSVKGFRESAFRSQIIISTPTPDSELPNP